jgi:hypothetical protein
MSQCLFQGEKACRVPRRVSGLSGSKEKRLVELQGELRLIGFQRDYWLIGFQETTGLSGSKEN